ncbi:MAG: GHKL domain-containing protein, partial [Eubacteriales bacterium]|nr:GHKL domain-containing protein [Eubacteriales bacterium]
GFTPDMINLGHSTNVYKIWADMIAFDRSTVAIGEETFCAFAGLRDYKNYVMKHDDINDIILNAIVNAIDACAAIEDGERSIHIQAGSRLNDVMISIKNTVGSRDAARKLQTSKKDKKLHGLGIPSIQRAAEKYQGFVSIAEDEKYFQLVILFVKEEQ